MNEPEIARATEDDLRELVRRRFADEVSRRIYVGYAQEASRGAWVARDAGTPIGIAFAREYTFELFVSEVFVEPSFRNAGIGWKLLREATRDAGDLALAGVVSAEDPGSLAFFVRRGLGLHVPLLRIAGEIPREDTLVRMAAGEYRFATAPIEGTSRLDDFDALDRETRGSAKPQDHEQFAASATGTAFYLQGECVGYAYVWPDGRVGPLAAASSNYLAPFFGFALASLRRTYGATWCTALVPGSNLRVMRAAASIGLNVEAVSIFASDQPQIDLSRYVGFHVLGF